MKSLIFASLVLMSASAQAAVLCGSISQDPDGFSIAMNDGITAHIGRQTFMSARGADRDLILATSKSGSPLCLSASVRPMDARNVLVQAIELVQIQVRR